VTSSGGCGPAARAATGRTYRVGVPTEQELLDLVLRLSAAMSSDLDGFSRSTGLTPARLHLIWLLREGPRPQHELARALELAPRTVTQHVDGLVAADHARRLPSPTDRRSVLVELTDEGRVVVEGLQRDRDELAHRVFAATSAARRRVVGEVLHEVTAAVEAALGRS
jgi:DNA-binding MarR family transcriptional regulator